MPAPQRFMFGAFQLDLRDERLWRGAAVAPLSPKPFAVLACLVTQAGQLVTKDALLAAVWPDTVVSEDVLTAAIRQLRRVLGDQMRSPRFIETVYGRGYRFIAPVRAATSAGAEGLGPALSDAPPSLLRRPRHFVGRATALARLAQWWTTARQGTRQVGIIAGEAGIGKTALVHTFVAQVTATADVWIGHGQCLDHYGAGEAYLPILEALGRLGRGPAGERLVAVLQQYAPSWLVQMPGLVPPSTRESLQRTAGGATQPRMLRELTEALDVLTTERPLVLVLDDLHWSDGATLAWLAAVARRPDPARLLLLGTYRPADAMVQAHPLRTVLTELQQHGQCVELVLEDLSDDEVMAYLCQRFENPELAATLTPVLHQRTHGNPLFLLAVVDELSRQQIIHAGPEGWAIQGRVETIATMVPETLQALIAHQLAQCSPAAQALLAAASVAGVEFAAAAVAACLERTDDEIEAQCATLAHHGQFLQARGRAEWPDGTITACFGFRHALYHDVVYQRIPAGRQTRWHARIGTRLAQGFGAQAGDLAAALARHCVRGRLLPQAVPYLRQAGETAMARSAHREAAGYFEQALGILSQLPEAQTTRAQSFDLWLALRTALLPAGDFERILAALRAAEALAVALDDPQRLGQVVVSLSVYYCFIGAYDQAVAAGQHTLALATASGEIALPALAHQYLGLAYYSQGDYRRAIDSLGQTVACLDGAQHREHFGVPILPAVNARAWLARCHAELGTFAAGRALGEEGLRIAEGVAHPASRMVAAHGSGLLALRRGDLRQALPRLAQAMGICQEVDLPLWFALIAQALGVAYTLAKRLADALPLLTRALEHSTATASVFTQAPCCLALGQAQLLAGHLEEAHARATQALALARAHQERGNEAYALRLLGDLAARHAPPAAAQAEAHYRQALALAEALGMRPLQAHCHRRLGMLYAATGQREQARSALLEALARYRAMQMTFWLPQTETALAQVDAC